LRNRLDAGELFPDFVFPDQDGKRRKLSEIQKTEALIVVLAEGYVCRGDRLQLRALVSFYPELCAGYTKIVTLISGNRKEAAGFRSRIGARWPFLYDSQNRAAKELNIENLEGSRKKSMIPHTVILKPGLIVFKVYNGYRYWERPTVEELRQDLRMLHREITPQWNDAEQLPAGIPV
jgi:peroxiredoxin